MKLFSPFKIGKLDLRNRIVMSPVGTLYGDNGFVTEKMIDYYVRRARGGTGLIIIEIAPVDASGAYNPGFIRIDHDQYIEGLARLNKAIKDFGTKTSILIFHPGRQASKRYTGMQPVAPSAVPHPVFKEVPKELSSEEIENLIHQFAQAAGRVKEAGLDSVQIHGAGGQLIHQFFSPLSNKRTDRYGGDIDGRARFAVEIVKAVRAKVGKDFPILFRISADECHENGLTLTDTKQIIRKIEAAGADAIDVIAGTYASFQCLIPPMIKPHGCNIHFAEEIKKVTNLPVIGSGRINTPLVAEQILNEKRADLIGMARGLIADPDFPKKTLEGRQDLIRRCIACNTCIDGIIYEASALKCAVNPEVGREKQFEIQPAENKKRVFVVGAGPGGMEAARILAQKEHGISLYEKTDRMGGNFRFAFVPQQKQEFEGIVEYLSGQMADNNIKVFMNKEITADFIVSEKPDAVVIATGSKPVVPDIPGLDRANVFSAADVLDGRAIVGQKVVVIGGGIVGCETAMVLGAEKKKITILEMLERWGKDISWTQKNLVIEPELDQKGVEIMTGAECQEIEAGGVRVIHDGTTKLIEADTVIMAAGYKVDDRLYNELKSQISEIYLIGDSKEPRKLIHAINDGADAALSI